MARNIIRMHCPPVSSNKEERVKKLFKEIELWINSDAMRKLILLYDGDIPLNVSMKEYIQWLDSFAEVWDFRRKQSQGGERWTISDDKKCEECKEIIMEAAHTLGLIDSEIPQQKPDYILPLGGARLANYVRVQGAKTIIDTFLDKTLTVVALSGKRQINEIEIPYLAEYAQGASNEYEAINGGLEKVFGLSESEYIETNLMTSNINLQWSKREYTEKYMAHPIYSLAAPSSDPKRRANSFDTFEFFLKNFDVGSGQRILLITSCIYVPFQLMKFMPISIDRNIAVDCIGFSRAIKETSSVRASSYLQEIKGTINAIKNLSDLYL